MDVEVREARIFIAVANSLSFTRAAEQLGLTQSALSQTITKLEQKLGLPLFQRNRQMVLLTPEGEALRPEAERLIASGENFNATASAISQHPEGPQATVRVAAPLTLLLGVLPEIISQSANHVAGKHPIMPIIRQMSESKQGQEFALGQLDIGFQRTWAQQSPGLIPLFAERLYVACHDSHPAANQHSAPLEVFAADVLLSYRRELAPTAYDALDEAIARSGVEMQISQHYEDEGDFLGLVATNTGIGVVPWSMTRVSVPHVKYVQIDDKYALSPVAIRYATGSSLAEDAANDFVETARRIFSPQRGNSLQY